MVVRILIFVALLHHCSLSLAHEYWIEPDRSEWLIGGTLSADVKNGENFLGTVLPFDPSLFARAGIVSNTMEKPLTGRLGDYPAIQLSLQEPGLHLMLLETVARQLEYEEKEVFLRFLKYHGFSDAVELSDVQLLGSDRIVERYYRFCKSLVDVGAGVEGVSNSQDGKKMAGNIKEPALGRQGQQFELVALSNPIESSLVRWQLWLDGRPLAGRQVELFHKETKGNATRMVSVSNEDGVVEFDVSEKGSYLLNSVWISAPENDNAQWESLWASFTFNKIR